MATLKTFAILLAVGYAGICAYLFFVQRSMIYFPTPVVHSTDAVRLDVDTGEATIRLWRVGAVESRAILYFGGNAEEVSKNAREFATAFPDHTIYLVNYRGYGGSSGSPSEQGLYHDALFLYDQLDGTHESVAVIGRSLGSGVATKLATERDIAWLVLVTPFDSISRVAQGHFRWLPVSLLIKDRFDSHGRAARITAPTLVLAASNDEIIPRRHTEALIEAITQAPLTVVELKGTSHNTVSDTPDYLAAIRQFIQFADQ
ncbi:MAG: hypothetical protein AAFN78_19810 [Pseudomonadota bacterium]